MGFYSRTEAEAFRSTVTGRNITIENTVVYTGIDSTPTPYFLVSWD